MLGILGSSGLIMLFVSWFLIFVVFLGWFLSFVIFLNFFNRSLSWLVFILCYFFKFF